MTIARHKQINPNERGGITRSPPASAGPGYAGHLRSDRKLISSDGGGPLQAWHGRFTSSTRGNLGTVRPPGHGGSPLGQGGLTGYSDRGGAPPGPARAIAAGEIVSTECGKVRVP